jgi:hypothetical protein
VCKSTKKVVRKAVKLSVSNFFIKKKKKSPLM